MNILPVKNGRKVAILAVCSILLALTSSCSNKTSPLTYFKDINELHSEVRQQAVRCLSWRRMMSCSSLSHRLSLRLAAPFNLPRPIPGFVRSLTSRRLPQTADFCGEFARRDKFPAAGPYTCGRYDHRAALRYADERISQSVEDPLVIVELVNFRVNVLAR